MSADPDEARRFLLAGERYWWGLPVDRSRPTVNGLPNFQYLTHKSGARSGHPYIVRGINALRLQDGGRAQLTLVTGASTAGSTTVPWHNYFDTSRGVGRYYGDGNLDYLGRGILPTETPGNRVLLDELRKAQSPRPRVRRLSAPIFCMRKVERSVYEFLGLAVLQSASHVTQLDPRDGSPFPNLLYELALLDLSPEGLRVDWEWINARRDAIGSESDKAAPRAWQFWVENGNDAIESARGVATSAPTRSRDEQLPPAGSRESSLLRELYVHFGGKKHEFEYLAAEIVAQILSESGTYRHGWVTRKGGDFGLDFVGALTVGVPPADTRLVLLGQAKCESAGRPTSATHVARTVSRLRRGWIAAYVTTSYFTEATQREVASDEYPIIMISGREVAQTVELMMRERHAASLTQLMETLNRRLRDDPPEAVVSLTAHFLWVDD